MKNYFIVALAGLSLALLQDWASPATAYLFPRSPLSRSVTTNSVSSRRGWVQQPQQQQVGKNSRTTSTTALRYINDETSNQDATTTPIDLNKHEQLSTAANEEEEGNLFFATSNFVDNDDDWIIRGAYDKWVVKYSKTPDEERYNIFKTHWLQQQEWNLRNCPETPRMLNFWGDYTEEEYLKHFLQPPPLLMEEPSATAEMMIMMMPSQPILDSLHKKKQHFATIIQPGQPAFQVPPRMATTTTSRRAITSATTTTNTSLPQNLGVLTFVPRPRQTEIIIRNLNNVTEEYLNHLTSTNNKNNDGTGNTSFLVSGDGSNLKSYLSALAKNTTFSSPCFPTRETSTTPITTYLDSINTIPSSILEQVDQDGHDDVIDIDIDMIDTEQYGSLDCNIRMPEKNAAWSAISTVHKKIFDDMVGLNNKLGNNFLVKSIPAVQTLLDLFPRKL